MKAQYENRVMSSLLLYVDHQLLKYGDAYTNHSSYFNETSQTYANFFNYAAPFKQLVSDVSVTGSASNLAPNVMTGVYLDNNFITPGQSGLNSINYLNGEAHFTTQITGANRVSGDYAVKNFNTYLTTLSEEEILFETKYHVKPSTIENQTGLAPGTQTFPAIFIKGTSSEDIPFSFGGTDQTNMNARLVVLADSAFDLDAACSILRDIVKTNVYLVQDDLPFNALGAYTGVAYNYTGIATGDYEDRLFLNKAYVSKNVGGLRPYDKVNPQMHTAFVDYELIVARNPRKFND